MTTRVGRAGLVAVMLAGLASIGVSLGASTPATASVKPLVGSCGDWMNSSQSPDTRASELVDVMSLNQKIHMLHQALADTAGSFGAAGYIPAIPSLCIPALVLNDAGSGLADAQTDVTAYPAAIAQASSWDPTLQRQVGASLGQEAFDKGVNVLLAPDVNIARVPLNGRTSEAFGEDPYLAGQTAAAYIQGVQSQHVMATVKHFDGNNQEANRMAINAHISQRTLEEIYQPPFNAALNQGGAAAVMCGYNQVNGAYDCQNGPLLQGDLDGQMGFKGFVVSDWGGTHSTVASALNGLDMEMGVVQEPALLAKLLPLDNGAIENYFGSPLKAAVLSGQVPVSDLNDMVHRILRSMFAVGLFDHPAPSLPVSYLTPVDTAANQFVALESAEAGSVLLKNSNGVLPLTNADKTIALIGLNASVGAETVNQAGGSVRVIQPLVSTPLTALLLRAAKEGDNVVYYDGSDPDVAATLAKSASVAIVYAGYTEEEGADLANFDFNNSVCTVAVSECVSEPSNSDQIISAVSAANPRTAVVLNTGGPALMPWLNQVSSVLEMWYPGEEDGNAAAALLFGDADPSGKLPVTFPASLSQLPTNTATQYPGVNGTEVYSEGLLVGYRWYDAEHLTPLFPFGFGMSYTSFAYSGLHLTPDGSTVKVTYTIANTGSRSGSDVAQVYVSDPAASGEPPDQLKAYQKTTLQPGQRSVVTLNLPASAFSDWSTATNSWQIAPGKYTIHLGDSSAGYALIATVTR
jgi:beta-glucosidase